MFKPKAILVPIDFSERSVASAEHAVALANHFEAGVVFAHIIPRTPYEYAAFEGGAYSGAVWPREEELEAGARKQIDAIVATLPARQPVEKVVLKGDPAGEIENLIEDKEIGLVVMPTHGYGPFRRFILGSVATKVLHGVTCPVFTGTHIPEVTPVNPEPYKRIACALDLREHSEDVLRWAWDFAQSYTEDLIVIHAAPSVEFGATYGDWFPMDAREALVRGARERVDALIEKVGCKAEVHVESADTLRFVRWAADESYADILVIGRSPKEGVLGRLRTHAYGLIREAPCPVLVVPCEG